MLYLPISIETSFSSSSSSSSSYFSYWQPTPSCWRQTLRSVEGNNHCLKSFVFCCLVECLFVHYRLILVVAFIDIWCPGSFRLFPDSITRVPATAPSSEVAVTWDAGATITAAPFGIRLELFCMVKVSVIDAIFIRSMYSTSPILNLEDHQILFGSLNLMRLLVASYDHQTYCWSNSLPKKRRNASLHRNFRQPMATFRTHPAERRAHSSKYGHVSIFCQNWKQL